VRLSNGQNTLGLQFKTECMCLECATVSTGVTQNISYAASCIFNLACFICGFTLILYFMNFKQLA